MRDEESEPKVKRASAPLAILGDDGIPRWRAIGGDIYERDEALEAIYMQAQQLKAPFPYFGGKSRIADQVWSRFGAVDNFVEPFFGSGAILLSCPWPGHTETVNDADGLLANFWRATQHAPDEVASFADWPVNEADLHARHRWLVDRRSLVEQLMSDPDWYDAQAAGWWVWGISQWIGTGWCPPIGAAPHQAPHLGDQGQGINRKLPHVGDAGRRVQRRGLTIDGELWKQRPMLGGNQHEGMGVHRASLGRKMPFIASPGADRKQHGLGVHGKRLSQQIPAISPTGAGGGLSDDALRSFASGALYDYFRALAARLRRTRVVCGDFERILGPSVTWRHGMTAVFLDPPYADGEHAVTYSGGGNVWGRVTKWCEENGENRQLRIALCGYADTWEAPVGWSLIRWRTAGGYGSQGNARGRENANREAIWFSPACLSPADEAKDAMSRSIVVPESDFTGTMFDL